MNCQKSSQWNDYSLLHKCKSVILEINLQLNDMILKNTALEKQNMEICSKNKHLLQDNASLRQIKNKINQQYNDLQQKYKNKQQEYGKKYCELEIQLQKYYQIQIQKSKQQLQMYKQQRSQLKRQIELERIKSDEYRIKYQQYLKKYTQTSEQNKTIIKQLQNKKQNEKLLDKKNQQLGKMVDKLQQENQNKYQFYKTKDKQTMVQLQQISKTIRNRILPQEQLLLSTLNKSNTPQQQSNYLNIYKGQLKKKKRCQTYLTPQINSAKKIKKTINPQLAQELQSIKHQISNQYYRIQCKKQGITQQRVTKTLNSIQYQLNQMLEKVQDSQSSQIS